MSVVEDQMKTLFVQLSQAISALDGMVTDMAMMHGDVEAMKIIFNKGKQKLAQQFSRKFGPFQTGKLPKSKEA